MVTIKQNYRDALTQVLAAPLADDSALTVQDAIDMLAMVTGYEVDDIATLGRAMDIVGTDYVAGSDSVRWTDVEDTLGHALAAVEFVRTNG